MVSPSSKRRILFTGYAPVHFVCFRPLFNHLVSLPGVEVHVSGGLRTKSESGYLYDEKGLYGPFGVPRESVLAVEEIKQRDFDVLFSANSKLIQPRSVTTRVQIFHGISFRNKAVRPENMDCDHYLVVGPYMQRRFTEAGFLLEDDERVVRTGFMKTDPLLNDELDREELLRHHRFDGTRPVLLYAPTGAKGNSLETMGDEVIQRLSDTGRYDVLVKPHDHPKKRRIDWRSRLSWFENDHCRIVWGGDVIPLAFLSDLLISDASSVSNEYALLDRPMIFLDVPDLIERTRATESSMLDLDTWGRKGGRVVKEAGEIVGAVEKSLGNPAEFSAVRGAMVKDLFYNPGKATVAAFDWFRSTLM